MVLISYWWCSLILTKKEISTSTFLSLMLLCSTNLSSHQHIFTSVPMGHTLLNCHLCRVSFPDYPGKITLLPAALQTLTVSTLLTVCKGVYYLSPHTSTKLQAVFFSSQINCPENSCMDREMPTKVLKG